MTIKNPKRFGLEVERHLGDVKNSTVALGSLGISPLDLEVIYNSTNADPPVDYDDWRSLSRLKTPLFKILDRYSNDTDQYNGILDKRAGTSGTLFGNLNVNGRLSGSAIRYRYIKGSGSSATAEIADISTSRVSAWSSSVPEPIPTTAAISYGARIGIKASRAGDGGRSILKFGTQRGAGLATGPRLRTTLVPQKVEFPSELPTSKIKVRVGGDLIELYAMKGIPVKFRGFFRNLYNAWTEVIGIDAGSGVVQPSWKIVRTDNRNDYSNFTNRTNIYYYSVRSRERDIELYYPPDSIKRLSIRYANIQELPVVKFSEMTYLDLSYNDIRTLPDFAGGIAPKLETVYLHQNKLYLSDNVGERRLNQAVVDKFPTTLTELNIVGCFYGTISGSSGSSVVKASILADRFPNLIQFNVGRGGGAYYHPDDNDAHGAGNCTIPNFNQNIQYIYIQSNDFRRFSASDTGNNRYNIKDAPNLKEINLYNNYYLTDTLNIGTNGITGSTSLTTVNTGNCNLPIFNMSIGPQANLQRYYGQYQRSAGSFFTSSSGTPAVFSGYKFAGCDSLSALYFYAASGLTGPFPKFNHSNLHTLDFTYTNMSGGGPNGALASDANFVIPRDTFENAPGLEEFYVQSNKLIKKPIHEEAFQFSPLLRNIRVRSYGEIDGSLPSFSALSNLYWLDFEGNAFTGSVPSFSSNPKIAYIYLHDNQFSGTIPSFKNLPQLDYLYLNNNRKSSTTGFTALSEFENLTWMRRFYAHVNRLQGEVPDFTECPRLEYLTLFDNQFTSYKAGSFKELRYIRYIDLSDNNLSQQAINKIVDDLYENYEAVPRGRVTINLRSNYAIGTSILSLPGVDQLEKIDILKNAGWTFLVGT